eukprot:2263975-Pyramimonas_sp.AAC.1
MSTVRDTDARMAAVRALARRAAAGGSPRGGGPEEDDGFRSADDGTWADRGTRPPRSAPEEYPAARGAPRPRRGVTAADGTRG